MEKKGIYQKELTLIQLCEDLIKQKEINPKRNEIENISEYSHYTRINFNEKEKQLYINLLLKYEIDKLLKNDTINEKGIEKGEFNWCFYCRGQANFFCDRINFPVCSHNCENKITELENIVNTIIISNIERYQVLDDYLNMIQLFSLAIKAYTNEHGIKIKKKINLQFIILDIILNIFKKIEKKNFERINSILADYLFPAIIKVMVFSKEYNELKIFKKSFEIIYFILNNKEQNWKLEIHSHILIIVNDIIIPILSGDNYEFKEYLIDFFMENNSLLFELNINYDCEFYTPYIYQRILEILTKYIDGMYNQKNEKNKKLKTIRFKCLDLVNKMINNLYSVTLDSISKINLEENLNEINRIKKKIEYRKIINKAVDKFNMNPSLVLKYLEENNLIISPREYNHLRDKIQINYKEEKDIIDSNLMNYFTDFPLIYEEKDKEIIIKKFLSKNILINSIITYDDYTSYIISIFIRYSLNKLDKKQISNYLSQSSPFNIKVLTYFIESFHFKNYDICEALHLIFDILPFNNEKEIIDRIIKIIIEKYVLDNFNNEKYPFNNKEYFSKLSSMCIEISSDMNKKKGKIKPMNNYIKSITDYIKNNINENIRIYGYSYICNIYNKILSWPLQFNVFTNKAENIMYKVDLYKRCDLFNKKYKGISEINNNDIKNILESSWTYFLGIFSKILISYNENTTCLRSIETILLFAKTCGITKLYTISDAFINTIINSSNIFFDNKELDSKSILCLNTLISFIELNGQYISSGWLNIIQMISKIDQYQHCPFSKNNTTKKEIYLKNSNKLSFISFDIIFESTVKYNIEILEQFINSLCEISRIELSISEDRLFCLQKMVEILGFNVNRKQDELDIIYNKISEHFLYIISRYHKNEILFIYSMDSLRQIVIKILNNNNNFIKNFETTLLRPFEIIFNDNLKKGKKLEIVMDCFSNIIENVKKIKKGWIVLFNIMQSIILEKIEDFYPLILNILKENEKEFENDISNFIENYQECLKNLSKIYLEEKLRNDIKILLTKLLKNIYKINIKDKKVHLLKIFIHSLDDIINNNPNLHTNLIFDLMYESLEEEIKLNEKNKENGAPVDKKIEKKFENNFLFLFCLFIQPHLVSLLLSRFKYIKSENTFYKSIQEGKNIEENSLNIILICETNNTNLITNNLNEEDVEIIKNINKEIIEDKEYLKKKFEIYRDLSPTQYEEILELFFQNFEKYKNSYPLLYHNLLIVLLQLSIYNKSSKLIFQILEKYLINEIENLNELIFKNIISCIFTILEFLKEISINPSEENYNEIIYFTYNFGNFLLQLLSKLFDFEKINFNMKEMYKNLCIINRKKKKTEINNKLNLSKIIISKQDIDTFKLISNIKTKIISKYKDIKELYDDSIINSINYICQIYEKSNNEEKNELLSVVESEIENVIPNFLTIMSKEELKNLFNILLILMESNNKNIRKISKSIIIKLVKDKLCIFKSFKNK